MGDATRRKMLSLLVTRGECTAGELGAPFAITQPTASKHLSVLERAGMVRRRRDGRAHRFRLRTGPLREAGAWMARHGTFWAGSLERLDRVLRDDAS